MAITRFFALIAFAFGAAQIVHAGVIPASNVTGSPTDYPSSLSSPSGDAPAPTDVTPDMNSPNATAGPMEYPSSSCIPPSYPSGFTSMASADMPAPTDPTGNNSPPSYSQPGSPPPSSSGLPCGPPTNGSAPTNHSQDGHRQKFHEGHKGSPNCSDHNDYPSTTTANGPAPTDMPQNATVPTGSDNPMPSFSQGAIPSGCSSPLPTSVLPTDGSAPSDLPRDGTSYNSSAGQMPQGCPTAFPSSALPSDVPAATGTPY